MEVDGWRLLGACKWKLTVEVMEMSQAMKMKREMCGQDFRTVGGKCRMLLIKKGNDAR